MQRTAASRSAADKASRSSACIVLVNAFSRSGRESVIVITPSPIAVRIAVNAMSLPDSSEDTPEVRLKAGKAACRL